MTLTSLLRLPTYAFHEHAWVPSHVLSFQVVDRAVWVDRHPVSVAQRHTGRVIAQHGLRLAQRRGNVAQSSAEMRQRKTPSAETHRGSRGPSSSAMQMVGRPIGMLFQVGCLVHQDIRNRGFTLQTR